LANTKAQRLQRSRTPIPGAGLPGLILQSGGLLHLCGQRAGTARQVMLGELIDPVSGIARGEQGDKAKTSLAAFTNISFLHYVRNGTVE
jgi:hypothetical protein